MIGFRTIAVDLDAPRLLQQIDRFEEHLVRRVGFETMRAAQQSIQPGAGASAPGSPPHDKTGVLKRFIRYAVDAAASLVIIGPEYLPRKGQDAPEALEHGGISVSARGTSLVIAQRAFMAPALGRTMPRVLPQLADSL